MTTQSKGTIVWELPFGQACGLGHLVRSTALAQEAKDRGYNVVLWTDGAIAEVPSRLRQLTEETFSEIVCSKNILSGSQTFAVLGKWADIKAVVVDDFRRAGRRAEFFKSLRESTGATIVMMSGTMDLEFDNVDYVVCVDLDATGLEERLGKKFIGGSTCALIRKDFFEEATLSEPLPAKGFAIIMGGTDPMNFSTPIIEQAAGLGFVPVLVARRNSPHAKDYEKALQKHTGAVWLENLSAAQMRLVLEGVSFAVIGPSSSLVFEAFAAKGCPIVVLPTNPSLLTNAKALESAGLPVIWPDIKKLSLCWDKAIGGGAKLPEGALADAVKKLADRRYLGNRLPAQTPFDAVDGKGAIRILKELGL